MTYFGHISMIDYIYQLVIILSLIGIILKMELWGCLQGVYGSNGFDKKQCRLLFCRKRLFIVAARILLFFVCEILNKMAYLYEIFKNVQYPFHIKIKKGNVHYGIHVENNKS